MRSLATLMLLATVMCGCTHEATLKSDTDGLPKPSPPIADCATDFRERGRPTERPIELHNELKAALETGMRAVGLSFEKLRADAPEPHCFYEVPDNELLMRDGRGMEFYFRKDPIWNLDRIAIHKVPCNRQDRLGGVC
jgi:hypothetical protein